jgi:hypothetical protein
MKVSKERRQLCKDVTNSHKAEERTRRAKELEKGLDALFMYALLAVMVITLIVLLVDFWRGL